MINNRFIKQLLGSFFGLVPIIAVILIFQIFIIQQPILNVARLMMGAFFVILGLTLFIQGIELSLFPLGESMAYAFARKGSLFWLLTFSFCLGFCAAIAEPGLMVIAKKAANIASVSNMIEKTDIAKANYAL